MSDLEPVPEGVELARGEADVVLAAAQLRAAPPPPGAVEIADRVLQRALRTPRRSRLVRAPAPHDYLQVSTLVITAALRERLDAALPGAAVGRVVIDVDGEQLSRLLVELVVQYGTDVRVLGEQAHALAVEVLVDLLGHGVVPDAGGAPVVVSHVHVSDVTVGDPHLVDPADEQV